MATAGGGRNVAGGISWGDLEFVVEHAVDADLPVHAFATVMAPLDALAGQDAALASAMQALQLIFEPAQVAVTDSETSPAPAAAALDRRGFFRRLAGRR